MKVISSAKGRKLTVSVSGELDHHGAKTAMAEIERLIDTTLPCECGLDMAGITFMDSSGIAVILKTRKRMNELGGRLFVENVPAQPMRILEMSGVDRLVRITAAK